MTIPDAARMPVLIGAAAVQQREEDPRRAREPAALMIEALERAADDVGNRAVLKRAECVLVPRGFWDYRDPARLVGEGIGASGARTILAEIGVLQTTLFGEAARAIATGEARIVLVTGGEAKYRTLRAQILGCEAPLTQQPESVKPTAVLRPREDVLHSLEIERGLYMPVSQFAMIENALRHADRTPVAEHQRAVGELWARFSRVAASNPAAWAKPQALQAQDIATPSEQNPMLAFPYTKRHTSSWNVDQAAGLVFCSAAMARELAVPEDRWIFPLGVVDSNHMLPLCERALPHRSPGFAHGGRHLAQRTGVSLDAIDHMELYSCFPAAVRVQLCELGVTKERSLTVTGGMAFAGGPLNNFVLQALVRMAQVLRQAPGSTGLVTAVSGILNKQGLSLWASRPPAHPFVHDDVAPDVADATPTVTVVPDRTGTGTIASYTVLFEGGAPRTAVALVDFPDAQRTIATTDDAGVVGEMLAAEFCGRPARVRAGARLVC